MTHIGNGQRLDTLRSEAGVGRGEQPERFHIEELCDLEDVLGPPELLLSALPFRDL
jgi:hypothetical protein